MKKEMNFTAKMASESRQEYVAPKLELLEVIVEHGFALSNEDNPPTEDW